MKKEMKKFLFAGCLGMALLGMASCSDSNTDGGEPVKIEVDPSLVSRGIETEVKSAVIDVPVNCNGRWIAVVDSCDWLSVLDNGAAIHQGNGKIQLKVDENRTQVGRKNTLRIWTMGNDDANPIEISVYQTNTYNGEPVSNGAGEWFSNNKVGCGANYAYFMAPDPTGTRKTLGFDPTKVGNENNIFNTTSLENYQTAHPQDDKLYINAQIPIADLKDKMLVNSVAKADSLSADIEMGCSFGFIEFQASGAYRGSVTDSSEYVNYSICREAPVLNSELQVKNIATIANKTIREKIDEATDTEDELLEKYTNTKRATKKEDIKQKILDICKPDFKGFFSTGFADAYWNLYNNWRLRKDFGYEPDSSGHYQEIDNLISVINDNYGPYFISGGQFGGALNLYATVDKKNLDEKVTFDAEITANISEAFNLSGKAYFSTAGKQLYQNSNVIMQVYGGNAGETANGIITLLGSDMTNSKKLQEILNKWVNSFATFEDGKAEPEHAAPISFTITPIWTLIGDANLSAYVRKYFMEKYKEQGIETWMRYTTASSLGDVENFLKKLANKEGASTNNKKGDSTGGTTTKK